MEIKWDGDYIIVDGVKVFAPQYQNRNTLMLSLHQRAEHLMNLGKDNEGSAHHQAADYIGATSRTGSLA